MMEQPASSPELNPTEHFCLWDLLECADHTSVTNTTTLSDSHKLLVDEWDPKNHECMFLTNVARLKR